MIVAGRDTPENCLKDGVDCILEILFFGHRIVDNWKSFSYCNCVSCTALNNSKSRMHLHWKWNAYSTVRLIVYKFKSGHYMV